LSRLNGLIGSIIMYIWAEK